MSVSSVEGVDLGKKRADQLGFDTGGNKDMRMASSRMASSPIEW